MSTNSSIRRDNPFDIYRASFTILKEDERDPYLETGLPSTDTSEQDDRSVLLINLSQYFPRFDILLALMTVLTWVRFVLYLRFFDPMIHQVTKVVQKISYFVMCWILLILVFVCISSLFFDQLTWAQSYDLTVDYLLSRDTLDIALPGKIYLALFLLFNVIILSNFVIALFNHEYEQGQFDELLLEQCTQMEYDERYGSIVCVTTPLEPIFLPLGWTLHVCNSNEVICRLLYFPLAVFMTVVLGAINFAAAPILLVLKAGSILASGFEQQTFTKAATKFAEVLVFMAASPLLFSFHVILDPLIFFMTLHQNSVRPIQPELIRNQSFNVFEEALVEFEGTATVKEFNSLLR